MLSEIIKKSLPIYEVYLPSKNKNFRFRPMTVKEEKILLLAQNEGKISEISYAIKTILESCFENLKDVSDMQLIDVQTAFLNLRAKSMGEVFSFQIKCPDTGENIVLECQLSDFKPVGNKNNSSKIKLQDDIVLMMKYPTLNYFINKTEDSQDEIKNLFLNCFVEIHTKENIITKNETSVKEIEEFFDSLSLKQYSEIISFFENVPKLELNMDYSTKDGVKRFIRFNGLDSFFELASAI